MGPLFLIYFISSVFFFSSVHSAVNNHVCADTSKGSSALKGLPRADRQLKPVSNNWGSYPLYTCTIDQITQQADCSWYDFGQFDYSNTSDPVVPYADSLVTYFGVGVAFGALTLLYGLCFGFWRYGLLCIIPGGCCGKIYPTKKTTLCCFPGVFGYVKENRADGTVQYAYPLQWRWANRVYMYIFVFFILLWIGLGHFNGNEALTQSMVSVANAPNTLVTTALRAPDVVASFAERLLGRDMRNLFEEMNTTINNVCDLHLVLNQTNCTLDVIRNFPSLDEISQFIHDEIASGLNMTDVINALNAALDQLEWDKDNITNKVIALRGVLSDIVGNQTAMDDANTNLTIVAAPVESLANTIQNPNTGCPAIISDLQALSSHPTDAEIDALTTAVTASLTRTLTDSVANDAEMLTLIANLDTVENKLLSLPNYMTTANRLSAINNAVTNAMMNDIFTQLEIQINTTEAILALFSAGGFPNTINQSVHELADMGYNVSFDGLYGVIDLLEQRVDSFTNSTEFRNKLDALLGFTELETCFQTLVDELLKINNTLITFPPSVDDAVDQMRQFNQTFQDWKNQVDNYTSNLDNFLSSGGTINFTDYRQQVRDAQQGVYDTIDELLNNTLTDQLKLSQNASQLTIDVDALLNQLRNFNSSLALTPPSLIQQLRDLETSISSITGRLNTMRAELVIYRFGWCAGSPATSCSIDVNCGLNGPCNNVRQVRCNPTPTTPCSHRDSDCGGGATCLVDTVRTTTMINDLQLLKTSWPDVTTTLADQIAMNQSSYTNLTLYLIQVDVANTAIQTISVSLMDQELSNLTDSLNKINITDQRQKYTDLLNDVQNLNLSEVDQLLQDMNSTMNEIQQRQPEVERIQRVVNAFDDLLFEGRLDGYLDALSESTLQAIRNGPQGIVGEVDQFSTVANDLVNYINSSQDFFSLTCCNFTEKTDSVRDVLRVLTDPNYTNHGAFHFFANLIQAIDGNSSDPKYVLPKSGLKEYRVQKNRDGVDYPNDMICLMSSCIKYEIEYWNNQPINKLFKEAPGSGLPVIPIPMSRTQLVSLPFLWPFFCALFGLISAVLFFEGSSANFFSSLCASCSACMMFCSMPLIFLFAGSFFPFVMFGGDACLGVENVGYQVLTQRQDTICDAFGGTGTAKNCTFEVYNGTSSSNSTSTSFPELTFNLNVPAVYSALLGGCNPNQDPLSPAFTSLSDSLQSFIPTKVDNYLNDTDGTGVEVQPPIKDLIRGFAVNASLTAAQFIDDLHAQVVGCDDLHKVYAAAKDAFCCDVLSAIYWMVASWYLIAWSMLCCGCGAAVMGRKRFPHKLWGAAYIRDMKQLQEGDKQEDGFDDWDGQAQPIQLDPITPQSGHAGGFEPPDVQFDGPELASGFEGHGSGPMGLAHREQSSGNLNIIPLGVPMQQSEPMSQPEQKPEEPEPEFVIERVDDQAMGGQAPPFDLGADGLDPQGGQQDTGGEIEI